MSKFLRITLTDGSLHISGPYTRLVNIKTFVRRVFARAEPFACWRPTGATEHPAVPGVPAMLRTRTFIPGDRIASVEEVEWTAHEVAPAYDLPDAQGWTPVAHVAPGAAGSYTVRADFIATALGVPVGTRFPIERRAQDNRPMVLLANGAVFLPRSNELVDAAGVVTTLTPPVPAPVALDGGQDEDVDDDEF